MSDGLFEVNAVWVLLSFLNFGLLLLFIFGILWAILRLRAVGRLEAKVRHLQARIDALESARGSTPD